VLLLDCLHELLELSIGVGYTVSKLNFLASLNEGPTKLQLVLLDIESVSAVALYECYIIACLLPTRSVVDEGPHPSGVQFCSFVEVTDVKSYSALLLTPYAKVEPVAVTSSITITAQEAVVLG